MATVVSRSFRSNPYRNAEQAWIAIVDLLTNNKSGVARNELLSVSGIAASVIADQSPKTSPIIVVCDGPRTRIYCLYDDDAIEGGDENEGVLGSDALNGDWTISLPCNSEDLSWVQNALSKITKRIIARDLSSQLKEKDITNSISDTSLIIDQKGFLGI